MKAEIRNPKSERMSKLEIRKAGVGQNRKVGIRNSTFGFVSGFGIRESNS